MCSGSLLLALAACGAPPGGSSGDAAGDTSADDSAAEETGGDTAPGDTAPEDSASEETGGDTAVAWTGPSLSFQDCAGDVVSLADLAAGTSGLVVGIGAGWCGPCQEDAPILEVFHEEHPDLGLATVLVEDADGSPVTRLFCDEWVAAFGLTYPVLVDPLLTTEAYIGGDGLPVHVAWRPDGTEVYRANGAFDGDAVLDALGG